MKLKFKIWIGIAVLSWIGTAYFLYATDQKATYVEALESTLNLLGSLAIVLGIMGYFLSRKQLDFSVIQSCIVRFNEQFASKIDDNPDKVRKPVQMVPPISI